MFLGLSLPLCLTLCVYVCGVIDSLLLSTWGAASLTQPFGKYGHNERTWQHIALALLASQFPLWETAQGLHSEPCPNKGPDSSRQQTGPTDSWVGNVTRCAECPLSDTLICSLGPPNPVNLSCSPFSFCCAHTSWYRIDKLSLASVTEYNKFEKRRWAGGGGVALVEGCSWWWWGLSIRSASFGPI